MKKFFMGLLLLVHTNVFAQILITFPVNRSVFQRNNSGGGVIPVGGTFQMRVDRVDARLISIKGGNSLDWTPISVNPNFGTFSGAIYANGGWYKLEIRAIRGSDIVGTAILEKVGVGEVFLIAGQSNAQGYEGRGNPPATDDRVNVVSNFYSYGQLSEPPFPVVSHLEENNKFATLGNGSWCWGKLGDLLTQKLNVPVLFLNAAYEALGIEEWKKSANGERGQDFYSGNYSLPGYPFENVRKSLHYYANMYGVRSILWHQGETDNDKNTLFDIYKDALQYIIFRSRSDTGKNISWVVSKASRTRRGTSQTIIDAQNSVVQTYPNVFDGPDTDAITHRSDGVHFEGISLIQLAEAWNNKLDNNFFFKSNPIPASFPLFFQMNCNVDNVNSPFKIIMPDGFKEYYWTNGFSDLTTNTSIQASPGFYRGRAVDYLGNVYYTVGVNYASGAIPNKPNLTAEGATSFCQGGSVRLRSSLDQELSWSTGESTQSIVVNQPGNYYVNKVNYLGCYNTSNAINVSILPKPEAKIEAQGATTFCSDEQVNLRSTTTNGNLWSSGENQQLITVNKSGEYFVRVKNEFGCENISEKIRITVNPKPNKPTIISDGPTVFCADRSVKLSSNMQNSITWNTGESSGSLVINKTGNFFVTAKNEFGCSNTSNIIAIKVNPLPPKPSITPSGLTTFCEGDSVMLTATESKAYLWNNTQTKREQRIKTPGAFSVKVTDENGCISPSSDEIKVTVKSSPLGIDILHSGTYTLETLTTGLFDVKFEWFKDGIKLPNESYSIKARETGQYSVKGSILYQLEDGKTLRCFSSPSNPYNFVIDPSNQGVSVFPNPISKDVVNIETLDDLENAVVSFYDIRGFVVREYKVAKFDTRKTFDLLDLPLGQYIVSVKNKDKSVLKRVFVEQK